MPRGLPASALTTGVRATSPDEQGKTDGLARNWGSWLSTELHHGCTCRHDLTKSTVPNSLGVPPIRTHDFRQSVNSPD